MQVGLKLFAEVYAPRELVRQAVAAEQAGFDFVEISDHFHPWLDRPDDAPLQGHSGFAWSILGMIAARTSRIRLGTGVTCPTVRYHPAIIAQAAATMSILSEGRFFLGVGSGERLNEHIVGQGWRSVSIRHEMLREALHIIRILWSGGFRSFDGQHLRLEDARIYDLPEELPEIIVASAGPKAARIAADNGGMFLTTPDAGLVKVHRSRGGSGTILGEMVCSFDPNSTEAGLQAGAKTARWAVLGPVACSEIPRAAVFGAASQSVSATELASSFATGPDPVDYLVKARTYADAGVDGLSIVNCAPNMDAFFDFAAEHLVEQIHNMATS